MRALWRHILAPLLMAAAVLTTGQQLQAMTAGAAVPGAASLAICPLGTHWDNTTQSCV
jgi:hypothetical protein